MSFILFNKIPFANSPAKTKIPCSPYTGEHTPSQDSSQWVGKAEAIERSAHFNTLNGVQYGVSKVLVPAEKIFCLDIDCGKVDQNDPLILELLVMGSKAGAYIEQSVSGLGWHIFGTYTGNQPNHSCKRVDLHIELYTCDRHIALGDVNAYPDILPECTELLNELIELYFNPKITSDVEVEWTTKPREELSVVVDDDTLIRIAKNGKEQADARFAEKLSFEDKFEINLAKFTLRWPNGEPPGYDQSSADMCLIESLMFWTGQNCEQIERIMNKSRLKREKWEDVRRINGIKSTWLRLSILNQIKLSEGKDVFINKLNISLETPMGANLQPTFDKNSQDWKERLNAHIEEFNNEFASTMIGGRHRIMKIQPKSESVFNRVTYTFHNRRDLELNYDNNPIQVGEKEVRAVIKPEFKNKMIAWATHPNSRSYPKGVVFHPGRELPKGYFNMWKGFSVEPVQNENLLATLDNHIFDIVCDGKIELYDYLIKWIAYTVQYPAKQAGSCVVLRGEKGIGKGILGTFLNNLWGNHGLHITNPKHLVGNFNGHLADVCFLFADEAFFSGDSAHEGILKALVTENTLIIEKKGIDSIAHPNYLKVFMSTNKGFAVPMSRDERRYCVFDVSSKYRGDKSYFNKLLKAVESADVQSAFLYKMLNLDLGDWKSGDIPDSVGSREQRFYSMDSVQQWLAESLLNGKFKTPFDSGEWCTEMTTIALFDNYSAWCDVNRVGEYRRRGMVRMSTYLSKLFTHSKNMGAGKNKRGFIFGSIASSIHQFETYEKVKLSEM
jgi:hypothetical protein